MFVASPSPFSARLSFSCSSPSLPLSLSPPLSPFPSHSSSLQLQTHYESDPFAWYFVSLFAVTFASFLTYLGFRRLRAVMKVGLGNSAKIAETEFRWLDRISGNTITNGGGAGGAGGVGGNVGGGGGGSLMSGLGFGGGGLGGNGKGGKGGGGRGSKGGKWKGI